MKRKQLALAAAALFGATATPAALADVSFNGFGQVIMGQTLEGSLDAPPYTDDPELAPESLFALQATAPVSDKLDAVAQIVSRGRDDYEPEFAWAYARYQIDNDWSVKLGRQRAPFYRYSDYLEVGAAYTQMRPSLAVYAGTSDNFDGVNLGRSWSLGSWEVSTNAIYGVSKDEAADSTVETPFEAGIFADAVYDEWLSFRLSGVKSKLTIQSAGLDQLFAGLRASGNAQTASDLDTVEEDSYLFGLAMGIERGNLKLEGELVESETSDSFIGKNSGWYVSAAYRVGKLTPIVSYGRMKAESDDVTPVGGPAAAMLGPAVTSVVASRNFEIEYSSVGLRYDLAANAAIKADYTKVDPDNADSTELVSAGLVFSF